MGMKDQLVKIKDNWLLVVIILILFFALNGFNFLGTLKSGGEMFSSNSDMGFYEAEGRGSYFPGSSGDFAPEVEDRKITKIVSGTVEIERGDFEVSMNSLDLFILGEEGIVLNKNINTYGKGLSKRKTGYYSIKILEENYDSFVSKIEGLGEIQSFSEGANDITGIYLGLSDQLELEKNKLEKYEEMLDDAISNDEKLLLIDRIFQQETTIKYLEDALNRQDLRIEYVTISLSLNEEASSFSGIGIVNWGDIFRNFMNSLNDAIIFIFWVVPWVVLFLIVRFFWKFFKKR